MMATNAWRLALLFAVSGFASAALFAKLGSRASFLRSRSARLLIPLVFGMAVIVPAQPWVELMFKHGYPAGFWYFWTHDYFRFGELEGIALPTWNHLWFVVYLWVYTLGLALALWLIPAGWRTAIARACEAVLAGPLLLIVPIALLLLRALVLFPGAEETHGLFDDLPTHPYYFPVFLFGWLLAHSEPVWISVRRWWKAAGVIALAG